MGYYTQYTVKVWYKETQDGGLQYPKILHSTFLKIIRKRIRDIVYNGYFKITKIEVEKGYMSGLNMEEKE